MLTGTKNKSIDLHSALRRMREASGLTMRQAGALVGLSHVAISQFENNKLKLPDSRVESLVKAYGYSQEDLEKILGRKPQLSPRDDCRAMVERLSEHQLSVICKLMSLLLSESSSQGAA